MVRTDGFSLVEVVLALALATLAGTVFVDAVLSTDRLAARESLATRGRLLAAECLEAVRWMRDADGLDSLTDGTYGLGADAGTWELLPGPDTADGFTRMTEISPAGDDEKSVACTVSWNDGASQSFTITTLLAR